MKPHPSLLLFFFVVQIRLTHNFFWNLDCFGGSQCTETNVKVFDEKDGTNRYNPLYLIGRLHSYKLAEPLVDEHNDDEVKIIYNAGKNLIYACPRESPDGKTRNIAPLLHRGEDVETPPEGGCFEATCPSKVQPTIKNLGKTCHTLKSEDEDVTFNFYEVGFEVYMESWVPEALNIFDLKKKLEYTWHPLYKVCHNNETRYTLYSKHKLLDVSTSAKSARCGSDFQDYDDGDEGKTSLLKEAFTQKASNQLFKRVRLREKEFLAKGHLTPDGDMPFPPWKCATFRYLNVAPMWQSVNNQHWKKLENAIRKASKTLKIPLIIYTGTYGTLTDRNNEAMFMTSTNDGKRKVMPIPAHLWKIVHNENTNEAIAFVTPNGDYNNRFYPIPCHDSDICQESLWLIDGIICCEVKALSKDVKYAPSLRGPKIMKNPNFEGKKRRRGSSDDEEENVGKRSKP